MSYLKLFVNCFRNLYFKKEFGNVKIPTIDLKISSFGIIMGYLLKARFPNHKSGDGWSPGKKPIDGTSEESERLLGCLNFICGRFNQVTGASDLLELVYARRGKNGYLLSPLMTFTSLFPVLGCVSVFAIIDYYSLHGVKIHSRLVISCSRLVDFFTARCRILNLFSSIGGNLL